MPRDISHRSSIQYKEDVGQHCIPFCHYVLIPKMTEICGVAESIFISRSQPIKIISGWGTCIGDFMNKYMIIQHYAKFHDEKKILGLILEKM